MKFDETSYKLFRQQIGKEVFKVPEPFPGKEICVALSGGLDSSAVLALYANLGKKIRTYSIGFKNKNENAIAKRVAKHFGIPHKSIIVTRSQFEKANKELITKKREPAQVPNEVLLYMLAKQFKKDIKGKKGIILSGEGCDEVFGGYTNLLENINYQKGDVVKNHLDYIVYDKYTWKLNIPFILGNKKKKYYEIFKKIAKQKKLKYDKIQHMLLSLHLPTLLQRLRSIRLVKGMDFHCPFLEPSWLYMYNVLPVEFRVNKTFLRLVFGRVLPSEVLDREKLGFPLPVDINKWQDWNLEVWKNGRSKIKYWK